MRVTKKNSNEEAKEQARLCEKRILDWEQQEQRLWDEDMSGSFEEQQAVSGTITEDLGKTIRGEVGEKANTLYGLYILGHENILWIDKYYV